MVRKIGPEELALKLKFGGGLSTRTPEDEIEDREAADGQNFILDALNSELQNRPPFDLVATAPNSGSIDGGGSLLKSDGTVKAFFQAGDKVYDFDGSSFDATALDTVSTNAKLRGHWRTHNWTLDDKVIVTDLALAEVVKEWDGTTWQDVSFTDENQAAFGNFFAKYCSIANERAIFSNIKDAAASPHLIVGSKRSDYTEITVTDRPSSSLGLDDPFFLLAPDLKPINGHVEAFGTTVISTEKGRLFNLTGSGSTDFAFRDFYAGSAAAGNESMEYIGNDIIYGRPGRIESVRDTDRFGDTEADDLTREILDQIKTYTGWTTVYNSRLNRVYIFPEGESEVWVFQTAMRGSGMSPWMRWVTDHALAFQPTFVASMLNPADGLEYVYMGDSSGNVYRLEGEGTSGDGGSASIETEFLSKLYSMPSDAKAFDLSGYVKYRKGAEVQMTLTFEYSGENVMDKSVTVTLPASQGGAHYSNSQYYSNGEYYGRAFERRLSRQKFVPPGTSTEFQVRVSVNSTAAFKLNEIGLRMRAASL